jgi:hypothetical protein
MTKLYKIKWTLVYLLLIPLVNWAFSWTPIVYLPDGGKWSPFSIVVGLILVFRDLAQREIGHYIFIPLMIGTTISYAMAPAAIASASCLAFFASEFIDWLIFTITKKPLSKRILLSTFAAIPVDSVIFLTGADIAIPGIFSWWTLGTMIASKLGGCYVVYLMLKRRERNIIPQTNL